MKMNRRFFLNVLETRFFVFLQNEKKRFFFVKGGRTRDGIPVVFFRCRCTVFLVPLTFLSLSLSLSFSHLRYFSSTVQWGIAEKSRELRKFIACATSPALLISAGLFFLFSFFYHLSPTSSSLPPPGIYFVSFRFCLFFFVFFVLVVFRFTEFIFRDVFPRNSPDFGLIDWTFCFLSQQKKQKRPTVPKSRDSFSYEKLRRSWGTHLWRE